MSLSEQVYSNFSGGFNDSVAAISIKDTEVCVSENADYSAEIKSFRTRKGCSKVNTTSQNADITDSHVWSIGSKNKHCVVMNSKVYDYNEANGTFIEKISITSGATKIYPFVVFNKFYFGDGSQLYVWGASDHSSAEEGMTSHNVTVGEVIKNDSSTATGVVGDFYQALVARSNVNLTTENYTDATNWVNVTEVNDFASSVAKVLTPYNPSLAEIVKITVVIGSSASGNITIYLNNVATTVAVSANDSVDTVVNKIVATSFSGWTVTKDNNSAIFTKNTVGLSTNGYVDVGSTGATITYTTEQEGAENDNKLDPIKKCTMFLVHTSSYRVFAAGNPDDNAIFYSEIGNPAYFKSDINKVYAVGSFGKPTGMLQLSESVLISFENGWYSWSGVTALDDATWKPLNLPYGCVCNRSIALTPYSFLYLGNDGLYNISASILSSELVLLQGENVIDKISKSKVDNAIGSIYDKSKCQGIFHENTYYLAYNVNNAPEYSDSLKYEVGDECTHNKIHYVCNTAIATPEAWNPAHWTETVPPNTRVLKYEWDTSSFTEITGWQVNSWSTDNYNLFFASTNFILKANDRDCDVDVATGNDKAIDLYIKTKEYNFGNPFVNKITRLIGLIFKQSQVTKDVNVDCRIITGYDYFDVNTININESLVWGRNWGLLWGFREAIVKMIELTKSSNTFQIEIRNRSLNSPITLVAIGFVYETTDFVTPTILKDEVLLT